MASGWSGQVVEDRSDELVKAPPAGFASDRQCNLAHEICAFAVAKGDQALRQVGR